MGKAEKKNCCNAGLWLIIFLFVFFCSNILEAQEESPNAVLSGYLAVTFPKKTMLCCQPDWRSPQLPVQAATAGFMRYGAVWTGQIIEKYHPRAFEILCQNHPRALSAYQNDETATGVTTHSLPDIYYYHSAFTTQKDNRFTTFDYSYISARHPEWILYEHKEGAPQSSSPLRWNGYNPAHPYYNRFYLDVGNPEFQEWAARALADKIRQRPQAIAAGHCYKGLALDNVCIDSWHRLIDGQYTGWKYAGSPGHWKRAWFSYLKRLSDIMRTNGLALHLNHTTDYGTTGADEEWRQLMQLADGLMDESALGLSGRKAWTGSKWQASIERHRAIIANGLSDWWVVYPKGEPDAVKEQSGYTFGSFLLTAEPGLSFFYADPEPSPSASEPWSRLYELSIGPPVSDAEKAGGCWKRKFKNLMVIVNPTQMPMRIEPPDSGEWTPADDLYDTPANMILPAAARFWVRDHRVNTLSAGGF